MSRVTRHDHSTDSADLAQGFRINDLHFTVSDPDEAVILEFPQDFLDAVF
jgi:hypothetical protein